MLPDGWVYCQVRHGMPWTGVFTRNQNVIDCLKIFEISIVCTTEKMQNCQFV